MSLERARLLVQRFREAVERHLPPSKSAHTARDAALARELLESMLLARHLDVAAHELRAAGHGQYTIASAGHEGNVVLGRLTRPSDPSLVHYRSAALQLERARQVVGPDPVLDIARSLVASSSDPVSGGRHKVFGSVELGIIPQTSTIASHLPRAVGLAFALTHREAQRHPAPWRAPSPPDDALVLASFGDASINHSTALGAFNAASWMAHRSLRLPLLFVCEDNGLGISVPSPAGWVAERLTSLPHIAYFHADATDLHAAWNAASRAVARCRTERRPVVLHLECVRLLGHAGSDVDTAYRSPDEIETALGRDPVLRAALSVIDAGALSAHEVLALDAAASERVRAAAERAVEEPKLASREQVMRPLARPIDDAAPAASVRRAATANEAGQSARRAATANEAGQSARRAATANEAGSETMTLAQGINVALGAALDRWPHVIVFGEDVARKGGVYGVTKGLLDRAGPARVFDTLLDEQTILGVALGSATMGLLPVPELSYLAYLHNAEDQLRGEAATLPFFSLGAFDNPMVVRIAGFAYQKGFGGHFHNDNSIAVLRDIPGLIVAVPCRADDALELFRTAFEIARTARRVIIVVEPIALYHERDLYAEGDRGWLASDSGRSARHGRVRVYHPEAADLAIVTYGNGVRLALRAARRLREEHGVHARIIDLRWLVPLPLDDLWIHAEQTDALLCVDECRGSGNISEALAAALLERGKAVRYARVTAADSFIPLGAAANLVLVSEDQILATALRLTPNP